MNRCGDEIDVALRCIQKADLEVSVFLCDNSPEELERVYRIGRKEAEKRLEDIRLWLQ